MELKAAAAGGGGGGGAAGGEQQQQQQLGPRGLINRTEYLRIIEQALQRLGYTQVAAALEAASGVKMQPQYVSQFQDHMLHARWEQAQQLLPSMAGSREVLQEATFLVLQQKYLEALEAGELVAALDCLRGEMAPLNVNTAKLHSLAALLMCPPGLGGGASGRLSVLQQLQSLLPPSLMLPQARLEILLEQALAAQVSRCQYHNAMDAHLSLLTDYQAGIECLPTQMVQVCEAHTDEVWHVSFSHCGTMLASASKDKTAIIWSLRLGQGGGTGGTTGRGEAGGTAGRQAAVQQRYMHPELKAAAPLGAAADGAAAAGGGGGGQQAVQWQAVQQAVQQYQGALVPIHVLQGHQEPVAFLCWSPDDRLLLTCSDDTLRLFDVATGQLLHRFSNPRESITSCAWLPDSKRFLSGSIDKTILMIDIQGQELQRWRRPYRIQDMAITHDGAFVIIASSERQLHIFRLSDQRDITLQETSPITSIALAPPHPSHSTFHSNLFGGGFAAAPGPWPASGAGGAGAQDPPLGGAGAGVGAGPSPGPCESQYLLVNLQGHTVHLWDIGAVTQGGYQGGSVDSGPDPMDQAPLSHLHEYRANEGKPGRYVIRSGFGGSGSNFVVHGSEDCKVYVWHRDSEELLLQLEGHSGTVNSVAWNPSNPHIMASASDDKTVRLWVSAAALGAGAGAGAGSC